MMASRRTGGADLYSGEKRMSSIRGDPSVFLVLRNSYVLLYWRLKLTICLNCLQQQYAREPHRGAAAVYSASLFAVGIQLDNLWY